MSATNVIVNGVLRPVNDYPAPSQDVVEVLCYRNGEFDASQSDTIVREKFQGIRFFNVEMRALGFPDPARAEAQAEAYRKLLDFQFDMQDYGVATTVIRDPDTNTTFVYHGYRTNGKHVGHDTGRSKGIVFNR